LAGEAAGRPGETLDARLAREEIHLIKAPTSQGVKVTETGSHEYIRGRIAVKGVVRSCSFQGGFWNPKLYLIPHLANIQIRNQEESL
jgi:hypothetical protein